MSSRTYLSIGDVLTLLREEFPDVTISKIRFLESQGLVNPERSPSGYRKFFEHDVERLRWVLRQQREHFLPLKVIRDRLADGDLGDDVAAEQPNGKTARPAQACPPALLRATPTSSRRRPTKRPWPAFSPMRRAGRPSCPTRSRRVQGCKSSPKSRPRRVPRPSPPRRVTSQPPRRAAPPASGAPTPLRRWEAAPPGLRCLRRLRWFRRHRRRRTRANGTGVAPTAGCCRDAARRRAHRLTRARARVSTRVARPLPRPRRVPPPS